MAIRSVVNFWQNGASHHQAPLIKSLAKDNSTQVRLYIRDREAGRSPHHGQDFPDYGDAEIVELGDSGWEETASNVHKDSFNIVTGFRSYPEVSAASSVLLDKCRDVVVQTEGWRTDPRPIGAMRRVRYARDSVKFGRRGALLLAIGKNCASQFETVGYPPGLIREYAYFVDPPSVASTDPFADTRLDGSAQILFVGSNEKRKNVTKLVASAASPHVGGCHLHLLGGSSSTLVPGQFAERVTKHGIVPNSEIGSYLRNADLLVLPSKFDGWGAVVSESLLAGTPVIVSSDVGAQVLVEGPQSTGLIFSNRDRNGLEDALREAQTLLRSGAFDRGAIKRWAIESTSPAVGAKYLQHMLHAWRDGTATPAAPWR